MALLKNAKGRIDGGYTRLFGNKSLGLLISRVQSAVISSGNELEKIIIELMPNKIADLDLFIDRDSDKYGTYLVDKVRIKHSKLSHKREPDFLVFKISPYALHRNHCYIIELKDGDSFDTKKSRAEREILLEFQSYISRLIPFTTSIHICSFNQDSKDNIIIGFKNCFSIKEVLTGRELCAILEIDYDTILDRRKQYQDANLDYFMRELLKLPNMEHYIKSALIDR